MPIYIGVQTSARDASVKSDLANAKVFMVAQFTKTNEYPDSLEELEAAGFVPGTTSSSGYTVEFEFFNVSASGFCLRGWADTDEAIRDLWVTDKTGVVGPIPIEDTEGRPAGCPTTD